MKGYFLPPSLNIGKPLNFAIDNIDFKNDTADDGKSEFHGTTLLTFQAKTNMKNELLKLSPCNSFKLTPPLLKDTFPKPSPPNESFPTFKPTCSLVDLSAYCNSDRFWGICQVIKEKEICPLPTWNAFNSLITCNPNVTSCEGLPLYSTTLTPIGQTYILLSSWHGESTWL